MSSIRPLPQSTVRALGATQALTDPASLCKELLDNALDANANSVAISISSNTLDVIQVRDNGHGIAPQDRPLVARRYCTSKICDDGDLKDIGGSSLGFRGEALASAAELSGSLLITTKIEGEQLATALKISQQGEVVGQERASLPIGTTVRITDFIKGNPVRRQVALKNVDACLKKIKRLLQAYAFARPHVRLSLQVLKAKNIKGDWVYAPKPNGNAEDAAFKIVGAACASSCLWSVIAEHGLTLQAFLPRPDADVSRISNIGSFLSIDARPVSSSRGLLKQVTKVFRESLKIADNKFDNVKDPFLFLEISGGSYDANLEPAKDDVLFEDADTVLQVVKQLFAAVYKPAAPPSVVVKEPAAAPASYVVPEEGDDDFTLALEHGLSKPLDGDRPISANVHKDATEDWLESTADQQDFQKPSSPAPERAPMVRSNMYEFDEEDLHLYDDRPTTGLTEADFAELRQSRNDVTLSNPWIIAKMNASNKGPMLETRNSRSPAQDPHMATNASRQSSPAHYQLNAGASGLPTPRPSSPSPPLDDLHRPGQVTDFRIPRDGRAIGPQALPPPQILTPAPSSALRNLNAQANDREQHAQAPQYPYALRQDSPELAMGTRLADIPDATSRRRRTQAARVNKPFVPPSIDPNQREQFWFDHLQDVGKPKARRARQSNNLGLGLVAQGELGDFVEGGRPLTPARRNRDIRDFVGRSASDSVSAMIENRNFDRTHRQPDLTHAEERENMFQEDAPPIEGRRNCGFMPASELIALNEHTPHVEKQPPRVSKRRRTTDRVALQERSTNTPVHIGEPEDEAEYRQETTRRAPSRRRSSKGLNRTKSSRLPLERVPPGQGTHDLIFNMSTDLEHFGRLVAKIDEDNSFLSYNEPTVDANGDFPSVEYPDLHALTARLHQLLVTAGGGTDVVDPAHLFEEVQAAYAQHGVDTETDVPMSSA